MNAKQCDITGELMELKQFESQKVFLVKGKHRPRNAIEIGPKVYNLLEQISEPKAWKQGDLYCVYEFELLPKPGEVTNVPVHESLPFQPLKDQGLDIPESVLTKTQGEELKFELEIDKQPKPPVPREPRTKKEPVPDEPSAISDEIKKRSRQGGKKAAVNLSDVKNRIREAGNDGIDMNNLAKAFKLKAANMYYYVNKLVGTKEVQIRKAVDCNYYYVKQTEQIDTDKSEDKKTCMGCGQKFIGPDTNFCQTCIGAAGGKA